MKNLTSIFSSLLVLFLAATSISAFPQETSAPSKTKVILSEDDEAVMKLLKSPPPKASRLLTEPTPKQELPKPDVKSAQPASAQEEIKVPKEEPKDEKNEKKSGDGEVKEVTSENKSSPRDKKPVAEDEGNKAEGPTTEKKLTSKSQTKIASADKSKKPSGDKIDDDKKTKEGEIEPKVIPDPKVSEPTLPQVSEAELVKLRHDIRRVLVHYYERPVSTQDYSPWGIMHALIAFGVDTEIYAGKQKVNAIGWLCWNGNCKGQRIMSLKNGTLAANVGPGFQGHEGQFLAMLAQSRVPTDYEIKIGNSRFTVEDLIEYEKKTCKPKTELTFKLIGFSHYLSTDDKWKSNDGREWNIEKLVAEEIDQPVIGAACGGTHRLMGLNYALRKRIREEKPLDGEFGRIETYLEDFRKYAMKLQNQDASFSTAWLERRENRDDIDRKIQTTGHILEWLSYSMTEEELKTPELVKTVRFLTDTLWENRSRDWEIGPRGHALHALSLYDQRIFGAQVGFGGPKMLWEGEEATKLR